MNSDGPLPAEAEKPTELGPGATQTGSSAMALNRERGLGASMGVTNPVVGRGSPSRGELGAGVRGQTSREMAEVGAEGLKGAVDGCAASVRGSSSGARETVTAGGRPAPVIRTGKGRLREGKASGRVI